MADIIPFRFPKKIFRDAPMTYTTLPINDALVALWGYDKVVIVGGPGCGKTYLANLISKKEERREVKRTVWCSDVYINDIPWAEQPLVITARLEKEKAYIAEGIAVLRAIKHGLLKPDCIVIRDIAHRPLGQLQARLWFQCQRWWADRAPGDAPVYRIVPNEMVGG